MLNKESENILVTRRLFDTHDSVKKKKIEELLVFKVVLTGLAHTHLPC